jgi:hypothetical protein
MVSLAFMRAAELLADAWRSAQGTRQAQDFEIALPIIQTYRHAIELILKARCFEVAKLVTLGSSMGYGHDTVPPDLENKLGHTHAIADVIDILNALMDGLDVHDDSRDLPAEVSQTLDYLQAVDARGTAFRYATEQVKGVKPPQWQQVRPNDTLIYLDSAITRLRDAAELLAYGLSGYLGAYEDTLMGLYSEWQDIQSSFGP